MKKKQYTVIITFISILVVFCFFSLFVDSDGFSPFENRHLAIRPSFSAEAFLKGNFADEYEAYLLDNFYLRDLSMLGYQTYSNMMFLDAFVHDETVLVSVDVDSFVRAGGQEGTSGVTDGDALGPDQVNSGGGLQDDGNSASEAAGNQNSIGTQQAESSNGSESGLQSQAPQKGNQGSAQLEPGQEAGAGALSGENQGHCDGQPSGQQQNNEGTRAGGGAASGIGSATGVSSGSTVDENADTKLNNSLIISGDRVMMPTGSSGNLELHGEIMSDFAEIMPELNVYSITGPTSAAFYASEKYCTGAYDQKKAESIIGRTADGVTIVNTYDMLMEHRDEDIYFRSDVHWTAVGAYYAYAAFCESAGIEAADIDNDFTKGTYERFLGGLYSQIYKTPQASRLKNNPEKLDYYIPKLGHDVTLYTMGNRKSPQNVDSIINTNFKSMGAYKYACFAWGDQHLEKISTDNPSGRKVLVLKDSYGSALIPFLVHNYSVVYVIDPKGFNNEGCLDFDAKTLINEEEIDDVIFCFSIYGSARQIIRDSLRSLLLK